MRKRVGSVDLCPRQNVTDLKGNFEWDYTPAGEYAFLPCPNGGWLEEYFPTAPPMMVAYRSCYPPTVKKKGLRQLFYEGAFWGEPVTDICRWSSETTWMLDDIRKAIREEILDMVIDTSVSAGVEGLYTVTSELGQEVVNLADRILDIGIWTLMKAHSSCLSIADNLEIYTERVKMGMLGDKLTLYGRNLYIEVEQTTPEYVEHLPNRWVVAPDTAMAGEKGGVEVRECKDGKKMPLNQLKGAVALLVLLGISWIFGAAAAVNFTIVPSGYEPQATANTFQALFAISVAFQGFFIFIFHCARYPDVRQQWKTTLTPKRCRRQNRKSSCIPTVSTGSVVDGIQVTRL
eukprot:XP_011680824.1 PREDICTED: uncharacterized protein LOC105446114 [Strongylocentrotus purpuratus]